MNQVYKRERHSSVDSLEQGIEYFPQGNHYIEKITNNNEPNELDENLTTRGKSDHYDNIQNKNDVIEIKGKEELFNIISQK